MEVASRRSPYIVGRPINERSLFFGRESLFANILDHLENRQQVILLHGQRRIGKSSVLAQIPNFIDTQKFTLISFDLQNKAQLSLNALLHSLTEAIMVRLEIATNDRLRSHLNTLTHDAEVFSQQILPAIFKILGDRNLLLLLDEFDVLNGSDRNVAVNQFFPYLQSILQQHEKLYVIPVVGRRLDDLPRLLSLFGSAPNHKIGLLDEISAENLIVEPARDILFYTPDAIQAILELTSGHPYFTQAMCAAIFAHARSVENWQVDREQVLRAVDDAIEISEGGLAWFRDGLNIPDRIIFYAVAASQPDTETSVETDKFEHEPLSFLETYGVKPTEALREAVSHLVESDFLELLPNHDLYSYRVQVDLVRRWLVRRYPLRQGIWELEEMSPEANHLYHEAVALSQSGQISQAIDLYEQALAADPNHFSALFALAELCLDAKLVERAVELYDRAYLVDPVRAHSHWEYAHQLWQYQQDFTVECMQPYTTASATKLERLRQESGLTAEDIYAIEQLVMQQIEAQKAELRLRYQTEVERIANRGRINPVNRRVLDRHREQLGISEEEAKAIERGIFKADREYQIREYEQAFREAVQHEYPFSDAIKQDLKELQQLLELEDKDIAAVEERINSRQVSIYTEAKSPKNIPKNITSFETVTVDKTGKIAKRNTGTAEFLTENLGNGVTLQMISIPGGEFRMGSPKGEGRENEYPQHLVKVAPFWMGKFSVTQAQYQSIMGTNPSYFKGGNRPVESISWNDALEFCQKISMQTGRYYRLPSEAEWEYACRAGTTDRFHFGETITTDLVNHNRSKGETTVVGSFQVANAFGLYDMHGNVWEWCADDWHKNYDGAPNDGNVWLNDKNRDMKLLRGGSWLLIARLCRSANRGGGDPDNSDYYIGFRVVFSASVSS